jgi:hypothetical protein
MKSQYVISNPLGKWVNKRKANRKIVLTMDQAKWVSAYLERIRLDDPTDPNVGRIKSIENSMDTQLWGKEYVAERNK